MRGRFPQTRDLRKRASIGYRVEPVSLHAGQVFAVTALLWIPWCVLGAARFLVYLSFCFIERTRPAASTRPSYFIWLTTSNGVCTGWCYLMGNKQKQLHLVDFHWKRGICSSQVTNTPHNPRDWPSGHRTCLWGIMAQVQLNMAIMDGFQLFLVLFLLNHWPIVYIVLHCPFGRYLFFLFIFALSLFHSYEFHFAIQPLCAPRQVRPHIHTYKPCT